MNNEFQKKLYLLMQALQAYPPEQMDNVTLLETHANVSELKKFTECFNVFTTEKDLVEKACQMLDAEMKKRGLDDNVCRFSILPDGQFGEGRETLKRNLKKLSFDEMMAFIDKVLETPLNDKQREAIIELGREVVMES